MKVVGYLRVSTSDQAANGVSLESQENKIKQWVNFKEWELVNIYRDDGISGKRMDNRDDFKRMINDIEPGMGVIVYSLSRLSRSLRDTLAIVDYFKKNDIELVTLVENIDTSTATGKFIFVVFSALNELESDQAGERTREIMSYKKKIGEKTGGATPYGFSSEIVKKDGKEVKILKENKEDNKMISDIIEKRRSGMKLKEICNELNLEGIKTKTGKEWSVKMLWKLLSKKGESKSFTKRKKGKLEGVN